ncbi:MAG: MASE1 domain-containing protein [Euryarchaeota archaeon]|nr:MASE1 domain-containing protein [Euryarchaeota archaeon]
MRNEVWPRRALATRGAAARFLILGCVAALYFLAGKFGLTLAIVNASATAVWPPTGIAIAAMLLLGYAAWPAVFVGAFLVNVTTAGGVTTSLGIATGNALEALTAAYLVNRFARGRFAFERARDVVAFAVLAGLVGTAVSATIGVTILGLSGLVAPGLSSQVFLTWWLGDATGALIFAPPLVLLANHRWRDVAVTRIAESVGLVASAFIASAIVVAPLGVPVGGNSSFQFLILPVVAWAAFRFGPIGAALITTLMSGVAVSATVSGFGPFQTPDPNEALLWLQVRTGVLSATALAFAAAVNERRAVSDALREGRDNLEKRVAERTSSLMHAMRALEREVDERRRTEVRLRASETQLADAQRIAHVGSWEWNVAQNHVAWSDELYRIFGLRPGAVDVNYELFLQRVHPEDRDRVDMIIMEAYKSHRPFTFEHRTTLSGSEIRWIRSRGTVEVDGAGKTVRMFGTAQDITATRLAEERFKVVLESAPDGMLLVGTEGNIAYASPEVEKIFGFTNEEVVGRPVEILLPKRFREAYEGHLDSFNQVPQSRPMDRGLELRAQRKDGSEVPVEVRLNPIETEGGMQVIAAVRDVTERENADAARADARRLDEMNRYKSQFINMAAHELATPLTPIKVQLHLLQNGDRGELTPEQKRAVDMVVRNNDRLATLVGEMLDVARLEGGRMKLEPKPLDLGGAVTEAVDSFGPLAVASGVKLETHVAAGLTVTADPLRLTQVLGNLLSNAIKFTPAGGEVVVDAEAHGQEVVVHVSDTGVGLTQGQMRQLFQPFSQVHEGAGRPKGGTGLGLYISKGLVGLHGGRLWVESEGPGHGTSFTFSLPTKA